MGVAVAVLNPQDCLKKPFIPKPLLSPPSHAKSSRDANRANRSSPNRSPPNRKSRRIHAGSGASPPMVDRSARPLVNGSVKILRRGEKLPDLTPAPALIDPLPTEIQAMPVQAAGGSDVVEGFYAGSAMWIVSPPPSSLPLPPFFGKKLNSSANSEATTTLVKILRLDVV